VETVPLAPLKINPFILEAAIGREYYPVIGNSAILNWLIRYDDSKLLLSDKITKKTMRGEDVEKILIITDIALYIINNNSLQVSNFNSLYISIVINFFSVIDG
jgi:hypothetical protein